MSRARIACGISFFVAMLAACASVADLDVKYQPEVNGADGGTDGGVDSALPLRGPVRDSSAVIVDVNQPPVDVSTVLPASCALGNVDEGGVDIGCDTAAGLGCCIRKNAANQCIEQKDLDTCGSGGVFVGCLRGSTDTGCCWRVRSDGITAALPCSDGGVPACLDDSDCPSAVKGSCRVLLCKGVMIGQCATQDPTCPQ